MALLEIPSRRSFGRQIILTFVVGFFLLISAFAALLILTERDNLHRDSVTEATSMAQSLAASALPWVLADDVAGLQEVVQAFRAYPEFNSAMVISPDGRVLAHSDPSKTGMFLADEQSKALLKSPHAIRVMEDSALLIEVAVPIEIGGRQVGWARVSSTKLGNTATLHAMIIEIAVFLLISTLLSFIAAMLIANRLGLRIGSLVRVAEGVQAGNFATRASTAGGEDEVARLGASLNKMLDTLSQNEHDLSAASHYTRSLIEASLDPLVTISAEGKITDVNRATETVTGLGRADLIGTDFSDYFTEPEKAREGYRKVFAQGFVTDYPLTLRHRDGHLTDVLYNASVYRGAAGKVMGAFAAARDITERNKAEAAMRESEALLQATIKILPVGLWVIGADGNIVFGNDAAKQIWAGVHYVGIEQLGTYKGWRVDTGKPVEPHEWAGVRALKKGETIIGDEIEIECFDGTHKLILDSAVPLRNADGSIRCAITVNQDITERKKLEAQHKQSFAYTRSLIEASLDPLVTISAVGKITDVNRATENATGRNRSDLVGTDFADYFTEPDKARAGYRQVFAQGFVTDYPLTLRHSDGHLTDVLYNASVYSDETGKVLGVFAAARDITERKKAAEEMARMSVRNRLILDSAGEGIYGLDVEGRITFINPAASQMLGFEVEELVGQHSHSTFHHTKPDGNPFPEEECPVQAAYKEGIVHRGGDLYWRKDGSSFPVEFFSTPILEAGNIAGAVVTFRDITERKQAENALREQERKFRTLFETANDGIFIQDENGFVDCNQRGAAMYGLTKEGVVGHSPAEFCPERQPDGRLSSEVAAEKIHAAMNGESQLFEWQALRHDNTTLDVDIGLSRIELGGSVYLQAIVRDISERKKAEEAVFEAQQVFRALIENSPDIIARYDRDCRRTYVNPSYLKASPIPQQDLLASSPALISPLPKASADILQNLLRRVLASGVAEAVDVIWPKGGSDTWYNIYAFPEHDREGRVVSVMTVSRDITERKQMEEALRKSEERMRLEVARMPIAYIVWDKKFCVTSWNPAAEHIFGFTFEEAKGRHPYDIIVPPEAQPQVDAIWSRLLAGDESAHSVNENQTKNGRTIICEWTNTPLKDPDGTVLGVMSMVQDITERKRAEEELKEQERHTQSLLRLSRKMEHAQTYADVMNAARDEVRDIIGYKNLWAYLFTEDKKHAKAIVASGPETDFIMSEEGTATLTIEGDRMLEEIAASKEIVVVADAQTDERVNKEIVSRMGNRTIVNIPIILFDRHFGCVGTGTFGEEGARVPSGSEQKYLMALASHMAAALDRIHLLAERKLAEDEVKALNRDLEQRVIARTADLQAANKELEAFSYSVSHDLRSPLRAIDGFSHILLDDYANTLDEEGKRLLNVVRYNTSRMGQLIDDILKFSRAGRLEMSFSEINMDVLARDVYEDLVPAAEGHEMQVEIGPLPPARGDRAMMRQVLVNLLSNAIKFTHGKVPARIKVGAYTDKNETVYFVQDNGAGFDMRYVDRLFGVFQRLHTESEFEGTGIGLAIVKRIVARHGGRTWAEGKVNEGATIYFALPAAAAVPG